MTKVLLVIWLVLLSCSSFAEISKNFKIYFGQLYSSDSNFFVSDKAALLRMEIGLKDDKDGFALAYEIFSENSLSETENSRFLILMYNYFPLNEKSELWVSKGAGWATLVSTDLLISSDKQSFSSEKKKESGLSLSTRIGLNVQLKEKFFLVLSVSLSYTGSSKLAELWWNGSGGLGYNF